MVRCCCFRAAQVLPGGWNGIRSPDLGFSAGGFVQEVSAPPPASPPPALVKVSRWVTQGIAG
jgi:hypothetical protein